MKIAGILLAMLLAALPSILAQAPRPPAAPPDLSGVYQAIAATTTLPGGLKNTGSPADLPLLPAVALQVKSVDRKQDRARMCGPVGAFRMMARERNKIELMPERNMIVMLFEDLSHGVMRTIYLNREHDKKAELWMGDSIGRWDGNTLVVDTTGFIDRTWMNDAGVPTTDALHMVERVRPILDGKYLEYKVTAEDPKTLAKPYTYTRYYEKLKTEIQQDVCEDEE